MPTVDVHVHPPCGGCGHRRGAGRDGAGTGTPGDARHGVGWARGGTRAPSAGTTVCVLTSRLAAEPQQLTTKLVRLTVETVENDGTLAAALTAWVVP